MPLEVIVKPLLISKLGFAMPPTFALILFASCCSNEMLFSLSVAIEVTLPNIASTFQYAVLDMETLHTAVATTVLLTFAVVITDAGKESIVVYSLLIVLT